MNKVKKALMGAPVAAVIALVPLCVPTAQAQPSDPCVSINEPGADQACTDQSPPDDPIRRYQGECHASPRWGAEGQFCRNFWVRESAAPDRARAI